MSSYQTYYYHWLLQRNGGCLFCVFLIFIHPLFYLPTLLSHTLFHECNRFEWISELTRLEKERSRILRLQGWKGVKAVCFPSVAMKMVTYFKIINNFFFSIIILSFLLILTWVAVPLASCSGVAFDRETRRSVANIYELDWIYWKGGSKHSLLESLFLLSLKLKLSGLIFLLLKFEGSKENLTLITFNQFQKFAMLYFFPMKNNEALVFKSLHIFRRNEKLWKILIQCWNIKILIFIFQKKVKINEGNHGYQLIGLICPCINKLYPLNHWAWV